jgi:type I restriction enzyme S subunit
MVEKVPKGWELVEWQDVATGFSSGATPYRARPEYYKGNIKWVTSGELNYNVIYDTIEKITQEAKERTSLSLLPKGTFLMAITGLEAAGTRGSCAILGTEATTNQSCMAIFPTEKLDIRYLFYYYVYKGEDFAFKYCQGTKQQSYTGKLVKQLPIVLPKSKQEQTAIAEALSDIDNFIASLEKLIVKKQNIKQGAMQELLTNKKRLREFNDKWTTKTIEDITIDVASGTTKEKHDTGKYIVYGSTGIIGYSNLFDYEGTNILVARVGANAGTINIACGSYGVSDNTLIIRCKDNVDKLFLYYKLKNYDLKSLVFGSGQPLITGRQLKRLKLLLPPTIEEQTVIAEILSEMDEEIETLIQKLNKYKDIKQGMMQELLIGKRRLV